ncbi:MAG: hypothetical protein H0V29_08060 [Thermoleophilaceae bacterium]|nr:hypothetical protein [Thermoleophilaceae bacterium]
MSILELLMSQRRWGRTRSRRILLGLGIPENKRIGTLTDRQRAALAAVLEPQHSTPMQSMPAPRVSGELVYAS